MDLAPLNNCQIKSMTICIELKHLAVLCERNQNLQTFVVFSYLESVWLN